VPSQLFDNHMVLSPSSFTAAFVSHPSAASPQDRTNSPTLKSPSNTTPTIFEFLRHPAVFLRHLRNLSLVALSFLSCTGQSIFLNLLSPVHHPTHPQDPEREGFDQARPPPLQVLPWVLGPQQGHGQWQEGPSTCPVQQAVAACPFPRHVRFACGECRSSSTPPTPTCTHQYTHTHTHTHTHARTCAHTHTHAHTHTYSDSVSSVPLVFSVHGLGWCVGVYLCLIVRHDMY
jgi:ABC-type nickel/cobalt efflux system permease component RcnA